MFCVKTLSEEDFSFATRLTSKMNWGLTDADFEFMMELEPKGCFVLLCGSEKVGIVTVVSFGKIGWFGNLIISEDHRRKGAGALLAKHAIDYLTDNNVETIGLYAYQDRVSFYRRLGFWDDSEFLILKGKEFRTFTETKVREARRQNVSEIIKYDRICFNASRRKSLEPIIMDSDNLCYMFTEGEQLLGYAVAKVSKKTAELGPLICPQGRSDIAIELLRTILNRLCESEVSICVPKKENSIISFLTESGFSESFHVTRMFLGPPISEKCIYVPESLERG